MSKYLIRTCETYRTDSEEEAQTLIENAKNNNTFTLIKYSNELKERKQKSEIIDQWYRVTLTKEFTSEKEPDSQVKPEYVEE